MPITMVQVSKLYDDPFLKKKTHFGLQNVFFFSEMDHHTV